jgi:hypothetical protein
MCLNQLAHALLRLADTPISGAEVHLGKADELCSAIAGVADDALDALDAWLLERLDVEFGLSLLIDICLPRRGSPRDGGPQRPSRRSEGLDASPWREPYCCGT